MCHLVCLINVCCIIDAIRNIGILPKTGHMQYEICYCRKHLKIRLVNFDSREIKADRYPEHSLARHIQDLNRSMLCIFRIREVQIKVAGIIKCLVVMKISHRAPVLVESRMVVSAIVHQGHEGAEIRHQRGVTALMILQMVNLLGKAADEVVDEKVEGVLLEVVHQGL
jgi:hypothetical protein